MPTIKVTFRVCLLTLIVIIDAAIGWCQDSRFAIRASGVIALPQGSFAGKEYNHGNAGTGSGFQTALIYKMKSGFSLETESGYLPFTENKKRDFKLLYTMIPLQLNVWYQILGQSFKLYYIAGIGYSYAKIDLKSPSGSYDDTSSKFLFNYALGVAAEYPIYGKFHLVGAVKWNSVKSNGESFLFNKAETSVKPEFDSDFITVSLGGQYVF